MFKMGMEGGTGSDRIILFHIASSFADNVPGLQPVSLLVLAQTLAQNKNNFCGMHLVDYYPVISFWRNPYL